jgi:hypothetical protein
MLEKPNQKMFFLNLLLVFNFTNIMSLSPADCKNKNINFVAKKLETKNPNITCEYKILNKKNCAKYFGKYCKLNYVDKGYQPVLIKFANNSDKPFEFSLNYFNIPCIPFDILADNAELNDTPGVVLNTLVSGIFYYTIIVPISSVLCTITLYTTVVILPILIPSITFSMLRTIGLGIGAAGYSYIFWDIYQDVTSLPTEPTSQNKKLSDDKEIFDKFSKKLLSEQKVEPFSTISGLIFVNKKDIDQYGIAFQENI